MSSKKHEINNNLQIILVHAEKHDPEIAHAVKAAVWNIRNLVNETSWEKLEREFDELLEKRYGS